MTLTTAELRTRARAALPEGYSVAAISAGSGWRSVDVRDGRGLPLSQLDAPDDAPWLEVHADTGRCRWYKGSVGAPVPSPLDERCDEHTETKEDGRCGERGPELPAA